MFNLKYLYGFLQSCTPEVEDKLCQLRNFLESYFFFVPIILVSTLHFGPMVFLCFFFRSEKNEDQS